MNEPAFAELTQVRELNERKELKKANHTLEEKDRQKDQFIALLAHELRNPLGAIRTVAYSLHRLDLKDGRTIPLVERFDRQTTAISRMLDDLLETSRIAFGPRSHHFLVQFPSTASIEHNWPHAMRGQQQTALKMPNSTTKVRLRVYDPNAEQLIRLT